MQLMAEFDGMKFRAVTEEDRARLEEWIAADPAHASLFEPEFFMGRAVNGNGEVGEDSRATCCALEDEKGTVFYVRLSRAARVHIQFAPWSAEEGERRRAAAGLVKGMAFLESLLGQVGTEEWIFQTESPKLKRMAERSLGFTESKGEMVRPIEAPKIVATGGKREADGLQEAE